MLIAALPAEWRQRAALLDPYAPAPAHAFREAAEELEHALHGAEGSVSLREAAAIGGYSVDHLQRLVRNGRLANVGRKGKPRLRRDQVPRRPGHVADLLAAEHAANLEPLAIVASVIRGDRR